MSFEALMAFALTVQGLFNLGLFLRLKRIEDWAGDMVQCIEILLKMKQLEIENGTQDISRL